MTTSQQRRRKLAVASASGLLLFGLVLVLLNLAAYWLFFRVDLTQRNAYSLSAASKKLVRELDDPLIIKAYFTPDLPSPYNTYARYARDLLSEYRAASRGKVRFEFVPTSPVQAFEKTAQEANLMPIQFQQMGANQFQVRRGYMGLVLFYRDKSETIPVIRSAEGLEYDITTKLARMARRAKKVVAFTTGHGEVEWRSPEAKLSQDLQELYELKPIPLPLATTAPIEADVLLVPGPTQALDDKSLWAIDQAIMRGIPTAFFADGRNVNPRQFMAMPSTSGLKPLLQHYGIGIGDQLVFDAQCQIVMMMQNVAGFTVRSPLAFPYMLLLAPPAGGHPITRDLDSISVPFSVTLATSTLAGVQRTTLLSSSEKSWLAPAQTYRVDPQSIPQPSVDDPHGPYTVAALYEGVFPSYFQGKAAPIPGASMVGTSPKTSIFVLGTSLVLSPGMPESPGTDAFVANTLAFLSKDETLLGVHPKGELMRPLKPVSPGTVRVIQIFGILGVPLLAAGWGLFRWRRRAAWRQGVTQSMTAPAAPEA